MDAPSRAVGGPLDMKTAFLDPLASGDIARASEVLADNVLLLLPGLEPVHGRARVTRVLALLRRRFADLAFSRGSSLDAGPGWLISTWTVAGRHADGRALRREIASVVRLDAQGRVAYLSDYFKSAQRAPEARANGREIAAPPPS